MNARFKSLMGHITENICILKVYSRGKDFLGHVSFAKKADKVFLVPKKGIKFISTHKKKKIGFHPCFIKNRDFCGRRNAQIG